jgi:hypothetical protein
MFTILAELFSTIGMVLLAGEYVQGRSRWFNRMLEHFIWRLFPKRLFQNKLLFSRENPFTVARGIVEQRGFYIFGSFLVPIGLLFVFASNLDNGNSHMSIFDRWDYAFKFSDPKTQARAVASMIGWKDVMKQCDALEDSFKNQRPAPDEATKTKAMRECLNKLPPFDLDVPLPQGLWFLIQNDPIGAILPCVLICLSFGIVLYLLSLTLLLSRVYTRLFHIESFILPVGFVFTAFGQVIKLIVVIS